MMGKEQATGNRQLRDREFSGGRKLELEITEPLSPQESLEI